MSLLRFVVIAALPTFAMASLAAAQQLQVTESLSSLEEAARRDSNDAAAHYQLALAYWAKRRFDGAERSLRTAVTIERRFAPGYLALAYLPYARRRSLMKEEVKGRVPEEWRDRVEESWRLRRRAFLIDPLVDLRIIGAVIPLPAGILLTPGGLIINRDPFAAFLRGDYQFAYRTFNAVAAGYTGARRGSIPDGLLWYRGLSAGHVGAYDTAIADFSTLLARGVAREQADSVLHIPLKTNDYRYVLALFHTRANHFTDAINLYEEALGNDVGLFMAHVQMGRIYESRQMWPQAVDQFQRAVAANPDDPSLLLDLGAVLRAAGQLSEAEAALRRAMDGNPRDSRVPYHLAITLEEEHQFSEARATLSRFLALAPTRYRNQIAEARRRLAALQP
ncbi:MAG TPA: tetratricopeptide repeat protein [Gemmatimonadales bacterium]